MAAVFVLEPPALEAINCAVQTPGFRYAYDGFSAVDVPPSPKVQIQVVGEFEDVSVKFTDNGAAPLAGYAVKFTTGGGMRTVIKLARVFVLVPPALPAIRVTL